MKRQGDSFRFSGSDLVGHIDCHHLTALNAAVARGELRRTYTPSAALNALFERGLVHERAYVEHLRQGGQEVVEVAGDEGIDSARIKRTMDLMRSGVDVIVQGAFEQDGWAGRTDILQRVEFPSAFGAWSYEVTDTKLSRRTKGGTILQLALYSDQLARVQERQPQLMHVVTPGAGFTPESYATASFAAYFRQSRLGLQQFMAGGAPAVTYPEPNEHCDVCTWRGTCDQRRRADDHLCLVAGISKLQISELRAHGVASCAALAETPVPLRWKPERGAASSFERVREQARLQVEGRAAQRTLYETLPVLEGFGLSRLPEPSAGDIFLDFEGDPFVDDGGQEYLFGYLYGNDDGVLHYQADWALTRADERAAFERFMDFVLERWTRFPDLHIYHYAPYEPSALKRLMGRYATRENELDRMLRASLFVDLYQIVRQGVRASIERYSIKELEPLYGFGRGTALVDARPALSAVESLLEFGDAEQIGENLKGTVAGYNQDDCESARRLRDWLETVRAELIASGAPMVRPKPAAADPAEEQSAWQARIEQLIQRLTDGVPEDKAERSAEQQARWILAHILDWHRREQKTAWWEYFRLAALAEDELLDERVALSGLVFAGAVGGTAKSPIHRYVFPAQETEFRGGEHLRRMGGERFGSVEKVSLAERTVDIKKRMDSAALHPRAVFAHNVIGTDVLAESLARAAEHVVARGLTGEGEYQAARDLLMRVSPRIGGRLLQVPGEDVLASALQLAPHMDGGILAIQGPPGTGKTYVGARMICALVRAGKRVGITATSHKVIRNLIDEVIEAAAAQDFAIRCIQKAEGGETAAPGLSFARTNDEVFGALAAGCQVAGGTAWLWAREDAREAVDVLFVDEAAQMSLANVLAVSQAARTVVLLGDPQQLDQPTQGSHPEGTNVSALDYVLNGQQTIAAGQGLFLAQTYRLHPEICAFTSELFYEGRLRSVAGAERQSVRSAGRLNGHGLRYVPVEHRGNQNFSLEEAGAVAALVSEILATSTTWTDKSGAERAVTLNDILIIAPYNAQVFELQARLPGARVGTVDKFQGQEAPIVIYSMTTSTHADAPRGMGFLYSLNRLNVATSRAQCLCVMVASPDLFEPECRTPEQMKMANAFCRYREMISPFCAPEAHSPAR